MDSVPPLKTLVPHYGDSVTTIDASVSSMSSAVDNIEEASLQVNSLLFPIMGAIAVILALQISIIARRR